MQPTHVIQWTDEAIRRTTPMTLNTTVSARGKHATVTWFAGLFGLEVNDTGPFDPSRRFAVVRVNEVNLDFYGISPV